MPIQGLRNDENWITNQRPQNWRQTVLMLYPNSAEISKAPLTALTSMMKSESTDDPVFHWFTKALDARRLKLNEDLDTTETGIDVDNTFQTALIVKAGDMVQIEASGEICRVSADPSANNLITVTRAMAGTTGIAVTLATSNPYINVIGSMFEEGSLPPTSVNYDPAESYNNTQIFRSTLGITRTAAKTRLRTGDAVAEAKRECLEYFSIDMERAFWFNGARTLTTINGQPARTTAGLINQILVGAPNNIVAAPAGGLINMDWLEANMELAFRFGGSEKLMFGSNKMLASIGAAIRKNSTFEIQSGIKEYGMAVSRISSPFGEIVFKVHPLFNQMQGGTASDGVTTFTSVANNAYLLDMSNIIYRYVTDVTYEKDLTPIGLDGQKSGYLGEVGLELHHPSAHFVFTGITGGTVDA